MTASQCDTALDYNILSNLSFQEHHWAKPGERPPQKDRIPQSRKVHAIRVKDFSIISNRYLDDNDAKQKRDHRFGLLEATQKYMARNNFDPVTQSFADPRHEAVAEAAEHGRQMEERLRAEVLIPPAIRGRQSTCYDIVSNKVHDKATMKLWDDAEAARMDRAMNTHKFEQQLHMQDIKGDYVDENRRRNRQAPERYHDVKARGYDIIDNRSFGSGPKEKLSFEASAKERPGAWQRIAEDRFATSEGSLAKSSSAPQLRRSEAAQRRATGRSEPSVRSTQSLPRFEPAPPGRTAPPAPHIPGSPGGSVYSRQKH